MDEADKIIERIMEDDAVRKEAAFQSYPVFLSIYGGRHFSHQFSFFHKEMMAIAEDENVRLAVVMAFRESGKSTILNLFHALWAVLGRQEKKFVLVVSRTKNQAREHFNNIISELEHNELLKKDLGPFKSETDDLGASFIELEAFGAKIMLIAAHQPIRGLKFGPHRPDLIICDDLEEFVAAQEEHNRKRLYDWFMTEMMPVGSDRTKVVVLGNLIHEESLLMRLKRQVDKNPQFGIFRAYPLLDDRNKVLWPQKFCTVESIERLRESIGDEEVFRREYLLKGDELVITFRDKGSRQHSVSRSGKKRTEKYSTKVIIPPLSCTRRTFVISAPSPGVCFRYLGKTPYTDP